MRGLHADTGYLLYRLGLRSGQLFNTFLQESGLRLRHYAVLRYLAGSAGALQRELSTRLGYDPSAIVGLVDDLEKLGLTQRRPPPHARRSQTVLLPRGGARPPPAGTRGGPAGGCPTPCSPRSPPPSARHSRPSC